MLTWGVSLLLIVVGLFIGSMSRRNMVFGVKIPIQLIRNEKVRKVKTVYIVRYVCVMIPFFALTMLLITKEARQMTSFTIVWIVITMILFVQSNREAKQVKEELKIEYRGSSEEVNRKKVTVMWDERKLKRHLSLAFIPNWLFIGLGTIVYIVKFPTLPDQIPMNLDFEGNVTSYADKSIFSVFLILLISVIVTLGIYGLMRLNLSAKKEISRLNPKEDGENLFIARERLNLVISAVILCMNILLIATPAFAFEWIPGGVNMVMISSLVMLVFIMIVFVIFIVTTGFSGDRLSKKNKNAEGLNEEKIYFEKSEEKWKLGMFYVNKDDPALMVEKRMGGGYTFNFGNPKAIWILLAILVVVLLTVIASAFLA